MMEIIRVNFIQFFIRLSRWQVDAYKKYPDILLSFLEHKCEVIWGCVDEWNISTVNRERRFGYK